MSGDYVDIEDLPGILRTAQSRMLGTVGNFNAIVEHWVQEAAFGAPGTPGDPDRIIHTADRAVSVYEDLLDTAAWLRGLPVTEETARRALGVLARYADQPIQAIRSFVNEYLREADTFIERLERKEKIDVQMTITFEVPPALSKEFDKALAAAEREAHRRRR